MSSACHSPVGLSSVGLNRRTKLALGFRFTIAIWLTASVGPVLGAETDISIGGDARWFQFQALESSAQDDHSERGAFRLKFDAKSDHWQFELHGLIEGASPSALRGGFETGGANARRSVRYWDLDTDIDTNGDRSIGGDIDRVNVRFQNDYIRVTLGRQAVTWGVNYFWPVLDLFSPFSPERIDRDYKPGVDAVRINVPVGQFSEIEVIGAVQGPETDRDRSFGALGRFHLGGADLGLMIGDFHRDRVLGAFVTASLFGTGVRAEVARTETSDLARAEGDPDDFVRVTIGVDRLLSPAVSLVFETTWNQYGVRRAQEFIPLIGRDRIRRGEITSLGELSSGVALSWLLSPLTSLNVSLLGNWHDGSVLLQPGGSRSLSNNADLLFGAIYGLGDEPEPGNLVGSEFGSTVSTVWAAFKISF